LSDISIYTLSLHFQPPLHHPAVSHISACSSILEVGIAGKGMMKSTKLEAIEIAEESVAVLSQEKDDEVGSCMIS
jgi:hypothetical protein